MRRILLSLGIFSALISATGSLAADSVSVQSMTVKAGAVGVVIPIQIHNDERVWAITCPLEFRSVTPGAFITRLSVEFSERLADSLSDLRVANQYGTKGGVCQPTGGSAYSTHVYRIEDSMTTVTAEPWGLLLGMATIYTRNRLPIGADSLGSIRLIVDVTDTAGTFEIDTTCMAPANVLTYITADHVRIHPAFSKGVITIDACNCSYHADLDGNGAIDGVDLSSLIDWVYSSIGPPPTDPSCPHIDRGDVDCSGADDAVDVSLMIDIVFFGSTACDPCACNSYPTSCP